MDYQTICQRMGTQVRALRQKRGLKQMDLALTAGVTRQKIIEVERGSPTVAMQAYARIIAALGCEIQLTPASMPTLDDVESLFK